MTHVAVIDYKLCNLDSIGRAVEACGASVIKTSDPDSLARADLLILPGVGHFGAAMDNLESFGLADAIRRQAGEGKPLLGICLGMQLLAERSEEAEGRRGLGLIPAEVVRLSDNTGERIPHMGWNAVEPIRPDPLLNSVEPGADFYFVHSYHMRCRDPADVAAETAYCGRFASVVSRGRVMGVQFHPEKSQTAGFALLENFFTTYGPAKVPVEAALASSWVRNAQGPRHPHPAAQGRGAGQRRPF